MEGTSLVVLKDAKEKQMETLQGESLLSCSCRVQKTDITVKKKVEDCLFNFSLPTTGKAQGDLKIQEVLQQAQRTKSESVTHHADGRTTAPWHHSSDNLRVEQELTARVLPWHRSTGQSSSL